MSKSYITLESLLDDNLKPILEEHLEGRNCRLSAGGGILIDDDHAAPCLFDSLRGTAVFTRMREKALEDAREVLRGLGDIVPEGATVRLYGIEFDRVEGNWTYPV